MNGFADFTFVEGRGFFRPIKVTTLAGAVDLIAAALARARQMQLQQLLIDARELTGFESPNTIQRYEMMNRWIDAADCRVQMAMILRPEMLDPQRFGLRVAENRGFVANAFVDEPSAIAWLDGMQG